MEIYIGLQPLQIIKDFQIYEFLAGLDVEFDEVKRENNR
jgi:hypothetical protein